MSGLRAAVAATCTECGHRHAGGPNIVHFRLSQGCVRCHGACEVKGYRRVRVDSLRKGDRFVALGTLLEYRFERDANGCCHVHRVARSAGQEPTMFAGCATALIAE